MTIEQLAHWAAGTLPKGERGILAVRDGDAAVITLARGEKEAADRVWAASRLVDLPLRAIVVVRNGKVETLRQEDENDAG